MLKCMRVATCVALAACAALAACGGGSDDAGTDSGTDGVDAGSDDAEADSQERADSDAPDASADAADSVEALPEPDYSPVVFAVVSDIHVDAGLADSVSTKVQKLLAGAGALTPQPEMIAVTGDLTDRMPEPLDTSLGSPLHTVKTLFAGAPVPVEATLGNHDYYTPGEGIFAATDDGPGREKVFAEMLGIQPWYYTVHGNTRFVYLNSIQGEEWKESLGLNGSMGQAQLEWLDALLGEGIKAVLFLHHPPSTVLDNAEPAFEKLVAKHADTVLAVFVGHIHVWDRTDIAGVPVFLTEAGYDGAGVHHVRVDAAAGTVEILNVPEVDYGEVEEPECDPSAPLQVADPASLDGTILELRMPDAQITPVGLGSYLRETMGSVPLVLKLGSGTPTKVPALVTAGSFSGDGTLVAPPYVKPVSDGPCLAVDMALDGGCLTTPPVTMAVDVAGMLGLPLPPGWRVRAELADLTISGVLSPAPGIEQGVLHAAIKLDLAVEDVKQIIVLEYCKGNIPKCKPGTGSMPACPQTPDAGFFQEVPEKCDVDLLGLGLRMIFSIFQSVPGLTVQMAANFTTWPASESSTQAAGAVADDLFATVDAGGTCPAQP
jgi:hypothetical protein